MVRGRRARAPKTHLGVVESFCASPKRKDSKLDFNGRLSHSPTNQKYNSNGAVNKITHPDQTNSKINLSIDPSKAMSKYQSITEFFQIQDRSLCFSNENISEIDRADSSSRMNDMIGVLSVPVTIDLTVENSSDIEAEPRQKSSSTDVALSDEASLDSGVAIESSSSVPTGSEDSNASSNECEIDPIVTIRTSPRKNPSTLANAHLQRVFRTPHRIGQYPALDVSPPRPIQDPLMITQHSQNVTPKKVRTFIDDHVKAKEDGPLDENLVNGIHNSPTSALSQLRIAFPRKHIKSRRRLKSNHSDNTPKIIIPDAEVDINQLNCPPIKNNKSVLSKTFASSESVVQNQTKKLTDYFPIRRSVRKTKKAVLEERQRDIEKALIEETEEGLEVHNFPGKGRGVVAAKHFARGTFVVEYCGDLISMNEARDRELLYARDENTGCYMYYFKHKNKQYCIDATKETGKLGRLVNHSRNGNLVTKTVQIGPIPHLVLVAKDDIQPGEEVTYDYGDRSKESLQHHPWLAL